MSESLPPYSGPEVECRKCGTHGARTRFDPWRIDPQIDIASVPTGAVVPTSPCMRRVCLNCDYTWDEATLDPQDWPEDDPRRAVSDMTACYVRCWPCQYGDHYPVPMWHTWADDEDVDHAKATGQSDPRDSRCACSCADAPRPAVSGSRAAELRSWAHGDTPDGDDAGETL